MTQKPPAGGGGGSSSSSRSEEASSRRYDLGLLDKAETYIKGLSRLTPDRQPEAHRQDPETEWRRQKDVAETLKGLTKIMIEVIKDLEKFGIYEETDYRLEEDSDQVDPPDESNCDYYANTQAFIKCWQPRWVYMWRKMFEHQGYWKFIWGQNDYVTSRLEETFWSAKDCCESLQSQIDECCGDYSSTSLSDRVNINDSGTTTTTLRDVIDTSAGAGDAEKLIKLDAAGKIDSTMVNDSSYSLADGTRAFTGRVEGVSPTTANHLTTKSYVGPRYDRQATAPLGPSAGDRWDRSGDETEFIYDGTRWLSVYVITLSMNRTSTLSSNQYLGFHRLNAMSGNKGWYADQKYRVVRMTSSASSVPADTETIDIYDDGVSVFTQTFDGVAVFKHDTVGVTIAKDSKVQLRYIYTAGITEPVSTIYMREEV